MASNRITMASNQTAMASNPIAMASNLIAMASNLIAMASNLIAMASNLTALASNLTVISCNLIAMALNLNHMFTKSVEKLVELYGKFYGKFCFLLHMSCRGTTAPGRARFIETFQVHDGISHGENMHTFMQTNLASELRNAIKFYRTHTHT